MLQMTVIECNHVANVYHYVALMDFLLFCKKKINDRECGRLETFILSEVSFRLKTNMSHPEF